MPGFLTSSSIIKQTGRNSYKLCINELFQDEDSTIYLAWRGFDTDNFTWLKNARWDIRCSHIHDVGCKHHQLLKVNLTVGELIAKDLLVLYEKKQEWYCKDIPIGYLEAVDKSKLEIDNLFYRMMKYANKPRSPKTIQLLYRLGVTFNIGYYLDSISHKVKPIDLDNLYK